MEFASPTRAAVLLRSPNVSAIRKRSTGEIVELQVSACGDDEKQPGRHGNSRKYVYRSESETNPHNVWAFRNLEPGVTW